MMIMMSLAGIAGDNVLVNAHNTSPQGRTQERERERDGERRREGDGE